MKKTVFCFVLIIGIMASLSSCLTSHTHKMVVDKNISADQNATVTFVGWFVVKEWNNKKIEDELYKGKGVWSNDKTKLTVPAGNTSFTFDVNFMLSSSSRTTTYSFENIELRYNLESGKEYQIKTIYKSLGFLKGYELFVGIYDETGKSTLLREWKLRET